MRIAGTGSAVPDRRMTNADFEKILDTNDEWIRQRTGIRERRRVDTEKGESTRTLCVDALRRALDEARTDGADLDLVIVATVTGEMLCPSVACRVAAEVGAAGAGAFDVTAACSGFVYAMNIAYELMRGGTYRCVGVIGCDTMSTIIDYKDRGVSILFGDAAGAAVLRPTDDLSKGLLAQAMHADGSGWKDLYLPRAARDFPEGVEADPAKYCKLQMNGREVFKFAVRTFGEVIQQTLDQVGLQPDDVDHYVCHQSNARILEASRERFGVPEEKLYVNIDRYGNSSAGSVPLCFDELRKAGRIKDGDVVMLVAFGGGLTWASSLWRV
ncbi:MAG: ketoacyl-ACP synthase III [Phycisphaerales bacterium]|nr:MAG: ketoacyl-ACP synthase III [Phycisphaerales bacterium]